MTKNLFLLLLIFAAFTGTVQAQTLDELNAKKAELEAVVKAKSAEAATAQAEIDGLQKQIDILSGWTKGLNGLIGFNFNKSNDWQANPNPSAASTALNLGITAFANREAEKAFWRNKGIITKSWQDVDLSSDDAESEDDDLFDNGVADILNISSLAGYKLSEKFALSGLGELNSSIGNFLEPGTLDIGVGATWTPMQNLVVVIHPLNYHVAFSGIDGLDTEGALGAKLRADYTNKYNIAGKDFNWSSTLTSFIPYSSDKQTIAEVLDDDGNVVTAAREAGLFEYTWLNTLSFEVWKGIGVGATFGIRESYFEFQDLQSFYALGLSYGF